MKEKIPIVHCFDHNYVLQAAVCFYSLLEHTSPSRRYQIEVVGSGLTAEDKQLLAGIIEKFPQAKIAFMESPTLDLPHFAKTNNFTKDVFIKLMIADLFSQYDRVVVSDVDVVYQGDIAEVFNTLNENDDAYLSGPLDVSYAVWHGEGILRDVGVPKSLKRYEKRYSKEELKQFRIGAGLMVYNLKRMRQDQFVQRALAFSKAHFNQLILPEQDVFNLLCGEYLKGFPLRMMAIAGYYADYQALTEDERKANPAWDKTYQQPIQIHYASGIKPWKYPDSPMADLWFDALLKSGLFPLWLKWIDRFMHGASRKCKRRSIFQWSLPFGKKQRLTFSLVKERLLK